MGHYPFAVQDHPLSPEDFTLFNKQFSQVVLHSIPFADGPVTFIGSEAYIEGFLHENHKPKYWQQYIRRIFRKQRSVIAARRPVLFLPVWEVDTIIGVAAVEGIAPRIAEDLSEEWLSDRSRIISREFFLEKQLAYDPVTGMLNGRHLHDMLVGLLDEFRTGHSRHARHRTEAGGKISLLLIEIHPRANNAEKALAYIARAGYFLESYLGQDVLHHLGNGVFGMIKRDTGEELAKILAKNILAWLRREGFSRVHIGINSLEPENRENLSDNFPVSNEFLENTWIALRKAVRRGPYALCTFSSISNPDLIPLKKAKPAVVARLRKLWADSDKFALLLVSQDRELNGNTFPKRVLALIEARGTAVVNNESETFVFLDDTDERKAGNWARDFKKKLTPDLGTTYSIGIACYPCIDFRKYDMVLNARKALLHAGFFGPDTVIAFDSVSQNVSGDIYYGEGDLVRAVREYRKGLEIEPANTNLLNSLGEVYARMNKPRMARPCFEKVLAVDKNHYMALFNAGITFLVTGEDEQAINYFERTLSVVKRKRNVSRPDDLILQLSKLYCNNNMYRKAVSLLEKEKLLEGDKPSTPGRNVLLRYLGEAYLGSGRNKEAIMALQRAVGHNPHDAYSMSMLGELYSLENQGDDIALSLCEQAVALDDRHPQHWYRLASIRFKLKQYDTALDAVRECLLRERKNHDVLYLAGRIYDKLGNRKRAAAMFRRVLAAEPGHEAADALEEINSE